MKWRVEVLEDVLKFRWSEACRVYIYLEVFHLLATSGGTAYLHFKAFDSREEVCKLYERVLRCQDFSPEGKPGIWLPIRDKRPVRPRNRRRREGLSLLSRR